MPPGDEPSGRLAALLAKDPDTHTAAAARLTLFVWQDLGDGASFVEPRVRSDFIARERTERTVQQWIKARPAAAASLYWVLGHAPLPLPAWASTDPETRQTVGGWGKEPLLVDRLRRWSQHREAPETITLKKAEAAPASPGDVAVGPMSPDEPERWLAAFLADAVAEADRLRTATARETSETPTPKPGAAQ